MSISRGRKIFLITISMTVALSSITFALIFNNEPVRLQGYSIIDPNKTLVEAGAAAVTVNDFGYMVGIVGAYATISYITALVAAKNQ